MESGERTSWPLPLNRRPEILFLNAYYRMKLKTEFASWDDTGPQGSFEKTEDYLY